jgi:tetratricopeptide (TPR) repeat protein
MARLRPHWALARIRAADLALTRGELERCAFWLEQPPAEALTNPWFHDVSARHAVQIGKLESALQAWEEAIRLAQADPAITALADVFEQRRREARRGPGVLLVRSLTNRGDTAAAIHLLERLLQDDPQWQPLRSLQEQLRHASPPDQEAPLPAGSSPGAAPQDGDGYSQLLNRAAACLEQRGVPLPEGATPPTGLDAAALAEELDTWSRSLSDFEARYALA